MFQYIASYEFISLQYSITNALELTKRSKMQIRHARIHNTTFIFREHFRHKDTRILLTCNIFNFDFIGVVYGRISKLTIQKKKVDDFFCVVTGQKKKHN